MAYFATIADYFTTTTGLLSLTTANRTVMAWVRNHVTIGVGLDNVTLGASGAFPPDGSGEGGLFTAAGDEPELYMDHPVGFFHDVSVSGPAPNTWMHVAWVKSGAQHRFLVNGVLATAEFTFDLSAAVAATTVFEFVGYDGFAAFNVSNLDVLYVREWNTSLSDADVQAEMVSQTAVHTANLWRDTPLTADANDDSGNARNWTTNGSPTFPADTPFPDVSDPADAVDLGTMPISYSAVVGADSLFNIWYTFTTPAAIKVAGIFVYGDATNYKPSFQLYTGTPPALALYWDEPFISGDPLNKATQCNIAAATTYYLKVLTNFPTSDSATPISISIVRGPELSVAAGDIFIPDDFQVSPPHGEYVHPSVFLSGTDGSVLNWGPQLPAPTGFASGLGGDILPSGVMLFEDDPNNRAIFYNADFTVGATLAGYTPTLQVRANRVANKFYTSQVSGGSSTVKTVSAAGAQLSTGALASGGTVLALASNNAETVLYFGNYLAASAIHTATLPGLVVGADLVAALASHYLWHILVMYDDSLIALYTNTALTTTIVKQYNASGALTNSYDLGAQIPGFGNPVLGYDDTGGVATDTYFWVLTHHTDNIHRLRRVKISDGTIDKDFQTPEFEEGVNAATAEADPERFGPPGSCPFVVLNSNNAFIGSTASLEVIKVTHPADSTAFNYTTTGTLVPDTFSLANGDTQSYPGLDPGTYGVTEDTTSGWITTYEVSNDDPHTAIVLSGGDSVTVTVTNTFSGSGGGIAEEFLIRRERWFPVINQENQRMTYSMLQVDLQAGNGLTTGQGSEPLLELDWSDDAGWTWSNIRFLPTGRLGQYNRRAIARVLGQSRQRVFRIAVSDPVQWVILDGYMQVKGGTS